MISGVDGHREGLAGTDESQVTAAANGDGLADLIVGAHYADPGGDSYAGESYVVFGKADGTAVELSTVASGTGGFVINGIDPSDFSGLSVSAAGDVNGDGLADLIVGAHCADPDGDSAAGESYVVFSPETAPASAFYIGYARAGDGAGGDPVVPLVFEDARMTIDYSDEDSAEDFTGGASLEVVLIERGLGDLSGLPTRHATTNWQWWSFRLGWADATFSFKYLDSEVANLSGPESSYVVYTAPSTSGPWTAQSTTVDEARNTVSVTLPAASVRSHLASDSIFAIGASTSYEKWVDFAWGGTETGTIPLPYNSLLEAVNSVASGGTINIKGDTADSDSPETLVINQAVTIRADGGTVTIGGPARRDAVRNSVDVSEEGFVSRPR